ncbi:hypothetical protein IT417_02415 [bacterium]|nr:hypothetical protein [bacterium]
MLKNILISKVRIKVLEQFFFNPTQQYHVRGLVRILDEEINAIRRELLNLEDAGLLKSQKQNNKILFTLNPNNQMLEDLRTLVIKSSELGKKVSRVAKECGKVSTVIATFAFLSGQHNSPDDVDFLFVGDIDVRKLAAGMKEVEMYLQKELKYAAITALDFDFGKKKRVPLILNSINSDFVTIVGSLRQLIL